MENQILKNSERKKSRKRLLDTDRLLALFCTERMGMILTFLSGFLLTRVSFFEQYAPLGVAFSAASNKKYSFAATAGAILGYITISGRVDGIKYIAAALLCFAAAHIFKETDAFDYRIFMPLISFVSMFGVGFVFLLEQGLTAKNILLFILELAVTMCAAWFYQDAQGFFSSGAPSASMPSYGTIVLIFSVLCAFSGLKIAGFISPVRVAAVIILMYVSAKFGNGAAAGFSAGLLTDMVCGVFPFFCIAYTTAGLCGGALAKKKNKWAFIAMFIISGSAAAVWCGTFALTASFVAEIVTASMIFAFLPRSLTARTETLDLSSQYAEKVREYAAKRLSDAANAFTEIYEFLTAGQSLKNQNHENMRVAFEYAAERVCKKCEICHSCWEQDYVGSFTAFNDATGAIIKSGRAEPEDYPNYFAARCLHFKDFCGQVNQAAAVMARQRKYKAKIEQSISAAGEQYSGTAQVFSELAEDIFKMPEFRPFDQKRAYSVICGYDKNCRVSVFKTRQGGIVIETDGANYQKLKQHEQELCGRLSRALGRCFDGFSHETLENSSKIIIREREKLSATVGVCVKKKHGENACGDSGIYFKTDDGTAYMLLSDGMGAGSEAGSASSAALKLFESLLKAGIEPAKAFRAAAPALKIKSEDSGFATLDIFSVNLTDGKAAVLKCGAAQSYVKTGDKISKISADSLPLGVMPSERAVPDTADMKMGSGDIAVVISDGIADDEDDLWLAEIIGKYSGEEPKDLAHEILDAAVKRGSEDDMTVLVMKLDAVYGKRHA